MKKLILSLGFAVLASGAFSQIIFSVEEPAGIAGNYNFTSNGDGSNWGLATLDGVYVLDTVVIPDDGTSGVNAQGNPASATGCNALPAGSLAGKIAMVFRGDGAATPIGACGFGLKAQICQNAGAVAVIIVNREEAMLNMDGGAVEGPTVTIPVAFVSLSTGQAIMNSINNGDDVIAFIGDKTGYFSDDIGFQKEDVLRAQFSGISNTLAATGTDYYVRPGAWVHNYGQDDQTGITLNATISGTPYNMTSGSVDILAGDSTYVVLPDYAPATWSVGAHTLSYTIAYSSGTEEYPSDNTSSSTFEITDEVISLARITNGLPTTDGGIKGTGVADDEAFYSCIVFRDPNASRIGVSGMYFAGSTVATDSLIDINVDLQLLEWNDVFTDLNDANIAVTMIPDVATASYTFTEDLQDSMIFVAFDQPVILEDNQRYLACVIDYTHRVYVGYDSQSKFAANENEFLQPLYPVQDAATWYVAGFTGGPVPAIGLKSFPADELTINENVLTASSYPNPSRDVVTVKINAEGDATLKVTDMSGRLISTQDVKIIGGQFTTNVAEMNSGNYVFTLDMNNGTTSRFNVVVTK